MADRVVLYARLSDPGATDAPSLDTQEAQLRAYAAEKGYIVVTVLREAFTGGVLRERPKIQECLRLLEARAVDVVVVQVDPETGEQPRWGWRDFRAVLRLTGRGRDYYRQHNARYRQLYPDVDASSPKTTAPSPDSSGDGAAYRDGREMTRP